MQYFSHGQFPLNGFILNLQRKRYITFACVSTERPIALTHSVQITSIIITRLGLCDIERRGDWVMTN